MAPNRSGHIATVGYEMYCQLLEESVRQLKHEPKPILPEAHVDIGLTAFIPKTYVPADRQRMGRYRRLTRCEDLETVDALQKDTIDAFGEPPRVMVSALCTDRNAPPRGPFRDRQDHQASA